LPTYSSPARGFGVDDNPVRFAFFVDPKSTVASSPLDSESVSDSDSILVDSILRFTGRLTGDEAGRGGGRDAFSLPLLDDGYGFGLVCVELDPFLYDDEISGREGVDGLILVVGLGGIGFFVMTLRTTGPPEPGFF